MRKILLLSTVCFLAITTVMAQRTVTGKITDDSGEGLPGVTVAIKGTTTGATSDIDGSYSLSVSNDATLVFSYIGFAQQEISVGSRSVIDVIMRPDVTELQEVIVTGSAVGKSKETMSFSVGSISEDLIQQVPNTNLGTGLQGKVAGLRVNSVSGQPGAGVFFSG